MLKGGTLIRAVIVFVACSLLMFFVFYFYPAEIFEAKVVNYFGEFEQDMSLRTMLTHQNLPENIVPDTLVSIRPTIKGGLILFICIIGLPIMVAWRTTVKKYRPDAGEVDEPETD